MRAAPLTAILGVGVLVAAFVFAAVAPASEWSAEMVDDAPYFWSWNPCNAVYRDGGSFHVAYAGDTVYLSLTGFDAGNTYALDGSFGANGSVSLARADDGHDLVAYVLQGSLRVADFDGFESSVVLVDAGPSIDGDLSLVGDASGWHIAYYDAATHELLYRHGDDSLEFDDAESIATVTSARSRVFIDKDGEVAVVYGDAGGVRVARRSGGDFSAPETVDAAATSVEAIDAIGDAATGDHVAYVNGGLLGYASDEGAGWSTVLWIAQAAGGPIDLALSGDLEPEILYKDGDATRLRRHFADAWIDASVPSAERTAAGALGYYADGGRVIFRVVDGASQHALQLEDENGDEILDLGRAAGRDPAVTRLGNGNLAMIYRVTSAPEGNEFLDLAVKDGDMIDTDRVFAFAASGGDADIAADGAGDVLAAFLSEAADGTRSVMALRGTPGAPLDDTQVFESGCGAPAISAKAVVDADGTAWVVYSNACSAEGTGAIAYGLVAGKGLITQVDPELDKDIGAALGPDGYPWVAYVDPVVSPAALRLAIHDGDAWSVVDLAHGDFLGPGIAFDWQGAAHVVAVDRDFGVADYLRDEDGVRRLPLAAGSFDGPVSLSRDGYGIPHAAFRTQSGKVRFAFYDVSGWRVLNVDVEAATSDPVRLAWDPDLGPAILLYDRYSKDPLLATLDPCADADGDDHVSLACDGDDCHDFRSDMFTGATEYCDGLDNDCDGTIDDACVPLPAEDDDTTDDDTAADDTAGDDTSGDDADDDTEPTADDDGGDDSTDDDTVPATDSGTPGSVTTADDGGCGCGC